MSYSPSYSHRHLLLNDLLHQYPADPSSSYGQGYRLSRSKTNTQHERSIALDTILLTGWAGARGHSQDLLQRADALRVTHQDFQVVGRLGDGQFGSVDAVQCKLDGQVYAMKTMPKHTIRRAGAQVSLELERHIHILAHSCAVAPIPKLFVAFQSQDSISLVTSYAACGSLWDRLCSLSDEEDQAGHMSVSEIQWWSPQMIVAIQWLHDQGYVHRDIKPHNFLITERGHLLLTDFGSAAELYQSNQSSQRPFISRDFCSLPIGTPDYIAPEVLLYAEDAFVQATEQDKNIQSPLAIGYDLSIDWWSFGATIYEMTTGKGPFWAPTIQQTYLLITQYEGNLQFPAQCNEGIRQLLQGLLQLPDQRVSGMETLMTFDIYCDVKWGDLDHLSPPTNLGRLSPIDLQSLPPSDDTRLSTSEYTFNHFFDASTSYESSSTSTTMRMTTKEPDLAPLARWIGWTWEPTPSSFQSSQLPANLQHTKQVHSPSVADFVTPKRPSATHIHRHEASSTTKRPIPGSHARSRKISDRQAFEDLVHCVQKSAQKQLSARAATSWRSGHSISKGPVPPTPTPLSRDTSKINHHVMIPKSQSRNRFSTPSLILSDFSERHSLINSNLNCLELRLRDMKRRLDGHKV